MLLLAVVFCPLLSAILPPKSPNSNLASVVVITLGCKLAGRVVVAPESMLNTVLVCAL